ncbi:virulence-associated protein E [Sphingomonadaceae bacterium]|nr:virulence-associated protein E [Sphingomonadaceae bacterium]
MPLICNEPTRELRELVDKIGGKWYAHHAMAKCPVHADTHPSLSIRQGNYGILVKCFAGCDPASILKALHAGQLRARPSSTVAGPAPTSDFALRIWNESEPLKGTRAEAYLAARRLPLNLPDLRFHPRCPHGRKPQMRFRPAIIAALRDGPAVRSIHRIFLHETRDWHDGKAMLGAPGFASWRQPLTGSVLGISEGIEDAAAFTKLTGIACWSAVTASRMARIAIAAKASAILMVHDLNWPGIAAMVQAKETFTARGLNVGEASPEPFEDWAEKNEEM